MLPGRISGTQWLCPKEEIQTQCHRVGKSSLAEKIQESSDCQSSVVFISWKNQEFSDTARDGESSGQVSPLSTCLRRYFDVVIVGLFFGHGLRK